MADHAGWGDTIHLAKHPPACSSSKMHDFTTASRPREKTRNTAQGPACEVRGAGVGDAALVQQQRDQAALVRQLRQAHVAHLQGLGQVCCDSLAAENQDLHREQRELADFGAVK
jgi:hypothetical protein